MSVSEITGHPSPSIRKGPCSLSKVPSRVAMATLLLLLSTGASASEPTITPITRGQIPPSFSRTCPATCMPSEKLSSYIGNHRVVGKPSEMLPQEWGMHHPGLIQTKKGRGYLVQEQDVRANHERHLSMVEKIYPQVKNLPDLKAEERDSQSDEGGFLVVAETPSKKGEKTKCLFALNPKKRANYEEAARYLTWMVNIENLSETEICIKLLNTHLRLVKGTRVPPGYRKRNGIVFQDIEEDQDRSEKGLQKLLMARGASKAELRVFKKLQHRLKGIQNGFDVNVNTLTPREKDVLSLLGYLSPSFHDVPRLMREFAREMKLMARQMRECPDFDPVGSAAYAHQRLGAIHPFSDANGRMSRLVANGLLRTAGYQPVVFPSDAEYTAAVIRDQAEPGHFASYLRQIIRWNEEQFSPDQPCLRELSCP